MRHANLFFAVIVAGPLSTACGHDDMDMMVDHAAELEAHLGASESEVSDHRALIDTATTIGEVQAEEGAHDARMSDHAGAMRHEMGDIMSCMEGASPDMTSMLDDVDGLAEERADHVMSMAKATTPSKWRAEEARHAARMSLLMEQLRDHMSSMMDAAGDLSCSHHQ